jgi:hypothetical protein
LYLDMRCRNGGKGLKYVLSETTALALMFDLVVWMRWEKMGMRLCIGPKRSACTIIHLGDLAHLGWFRKGIGKDASSCIYLL